MRLRGDKSNEGIKRKILRNYKLQYPIPSYRPELLHLKYGYQICPTQQEIFLNNFKISNLRISYRNSKVQWFGLINLSKLKRPLSQTIELGDGCIEVYKLQCEKPLIGEELNKKCFASFMMKRRLNPSKIMRRCQQNKTTIVNLDIMNNFLQVQIPHFTKYNFNNDDSDQQEQKQQHSIQYKPKKSTSPIPSERNIINSIIDNHIRSNNQPRQSPLNQQQFTNPSNHLRSEVQEHNKASCKLNKGVSLEQRFSANGTFKLTKKKHQYFLIQSLVGKSAETSLELNKFFEILKQNGQNNQLQMERAIVDKKIPFKMRRLFSLLFLSFFPSSTLLSFTNNEFIIGKKHKQNQTERYLKCWLKWSILYSSIELPQNNIYKNLAIREPQNLIKNYLKGSTLDNAEFLACIEDPMYRFDYSERKIQPQLSIINHEMYESLPKMHWIVNLGFLFWYFVQLQKTQQKLIKILERPQNVHDCQNQFRLFQIYYYSITKSAYYDHTKLLYSNEQSDLQQNIAIWYTSNSIEKQQSALFKSDQYKKYRYRLMRQIIFELKQIEKVDILLKLDKYLPQDCKRQLLNEYCNLHPEQLNQMMQLGFNRIITHQQRALNYLNRYDLNQAIQQLSKLLSTKERQYNKALYTQTLIKLIKRRQIIFNTNQTVLQKTYQSIKNINHPQLKRAKIWLSMLLKTQHLTIEKLKELLLFYEGFSESNKKMFKSLLLFELEKILQIRELQKDMQCRKKLLEIYHDNKTATIKIKMIKMIK